MKKAVYSIYITFAALIGLSACKKETTPKALEIQKPKVYSEAYYANLRAYKASDHSKCFVWLSDYGKQVTSASLGERFAGLPDSVDIISLWGGFPDEVKNPTDYKEMRFAQKVKGAKLLAVVIIDIGKYPKNDAGIAQYIAELKREVYNKDLDGLDLDYEPSDGFFTIESNFIKLVTGLSQFLGPKSGTGKTLNIDYFDRRPPGILADYVDFIVFQNYSNQTFSVNDQRNDNYYSSLSVDYPPNKYFITENMGDLWQTGGSPYTLNDGTVVNSLLGYAKWNPAQGRKGGFGGFFVQRDYYNGTPYGYLRAAIQAQNPAKN